MNVETRDGDMDARATIERNPEKGGTSAVDKAMSRKSKGFTEEEKAAMREHVREQKENEADGETLVLGKISAMKEPDRTMAKRVHAIIRASAPSLTPRLWYGMPAYANEKGIAVCFFQDAQKFKTRYATLGFSDKASLDDGRMWPVAFALKELTATEEARIASLVRKAASRG